MPIGTTLVGDDDMISNGVSDLVMQTDGNLVFYVDDFYYPGSKYVCWASNTEGHPGARAVYQADGNFVVYSAANRALWSSGTNGRSASTVRIVENAGGYPRVYVGNTPYGPFNCPDGYPGP
ncbi:hypothetical protein [Subtercola sp. YIM 133946]|uniref:hypothetical protein n=1 Tax=Subtercola sp. YIM 133946 TaxID=3118909 RepID=UPI002F92D34E